MDYKKLFEDFADQSVFIKSTERPVIDGTQKAALNRKGNILLNSGDVEGARRIFLTTGYSDGLARVGDKYKAQGRPLDALRMYWMAPDRTKAEPVMAQISQVIRNLIQEGEGSPNE
ncbi:MAG: hypothetical protein LBG84_00255 [Treponema sp.]|nr:hypothetical protein [Treponema sp.]